MDDHTIRLERKHYVTDDLCFLSFSRPDDFSFKAGQFVNLQIRRDNTTRYRPYSLYNHPEEASLRILVKLVDDGFASGWFADADPGVSVTMSGPLGAFTLSDADHHVFLATGTGVAPFHALIQEALRRDDTAELYYGTRTPDRLAGHGDFEDLAEQPGFDYNPVLSRDSSANRSGYVQDHAPLYDDAAYYLCGLGEFVLDAEEFLQSSGLDESLINTERYD